MDETPARWPIAELARRVAAALAVGYDGPGNARVRGIPDVRSIRWYATIGLLDKPAGYRGRTALYGPRHLRQLVAVKRRQAAGAALAEIQAELTGASDDALARLANLPAQANGYDLAPVPAGAAAGPGSAEAPSASGSADTGQGAAEATFWKSQPVNVTVAAARHDAPPSGPALAYGVRLGEGLTVLVDAPHPPTEADLEAVRAAAQPLLRVVRARGLSHTGVTP